MKRIWIKLFIEILDDPKMGRLPNHLWRRSIELFLLAGRNGNDGLLPPVEEMAWTLRSSDDEVVKGLTSLAEIGVVHETPQGWVVTHFKERQAALTATERVHAFRERKRNENETKRFNDDNESEVTDSISYSSSVSSIFIDSFGEFNSKRESTRWSILFEAAGKKQAEELIAWALRKEIHLLNRAGLMDSLETAAKNWNSKSTKVNNNGAKEPKGFSSGRVWLASKGVKVNG